MAVDWITGGYSKDVAADWREVEEFLRQAYRALRQIETPAQKLIGVPNFITFVQLRLDNCPLSGMRHLS